MIFFLVIPIAIVGVYSLFSKGPYGGIVLNLNLENYKRAFDLLYIHIFLTSLKLALLTALSCLLIGYPVAYVMATAGPRMRILLMMLLIVPFWTNFVVRTYALKIFLGELGPVSQFFLGLGIISEPLQLSNSFTMVWLGMVTNYLPYMVLPLYVSIEKFDFSLLEAGQDLGASAWNNFWRILVPLTRGGIITGFILVFTPALGEFLIPDLLGGAKTMLLGNLITEQFLKMRDWPFGSALSVLLMIVVTLSLVIVIRIWMAEENAGKKIRLESSAS